MGSCGYSNGGTSPIGGEEKILERPKSSGDMATLVLKACSWFLASYPFGEQGKLLNCTSCLGMRGGGNVMAMPSWLGRPVGEVMTSP